MVSARDVAAMRLAIGVDLGPQDGITRSAAMVELSFCVLPAPRVVASKVLHGGVVLPLASINGRLPFGHGCLYDIDRSAMYEL